MTTTELPTATLAADVDPDSTAVALCDACGHEDARHDVISRRYCSATMSGALSRDCICAGQ